MTPQYAAFLATSALAMGAGAALAWKVRPHLPVALLLAFGLGCDLVQEVVRPIYLGHPRPFSGAARIAWHVGQAAFAAYPWAILAVAVVVLTGHGRRWIAVTVGVAWVAYEALLIAGYHALDLRGERLGLVYLAAQALLVLGMGAVVVPWWRRWRAAWRAERLAPSATEILAALACGVELVILAGPLLLGAPWAHARWIVLARPAYATYYLIAILMHGGALWTRYSSTA